MFYDLSVLLLYCAIALASDVRLVAPKAENQVFYWDSAFTWIGSYPTQSSIVFVDGKGMNPILVINVPPKVHSLHVFGATLRLESFDVVIPHTTTLDDVVVESDIGEIANFTTTNLEVLGSCELSLISFVIKGNGKLAGILSLSQSSLLVDFGAEFVIEGGSSDSFELKAWGDGRHGRTGTGHSYHPHPLLPVDTDEEFTFIACGNDHTLGITSEGTLFAGGRNHVGQLGLGYIHGETNFPQPANFNNVVVQISAGGDFSLARTVDNLVYSWGTATGGVLGHGYGGSFESTPKRITSLENVVDISAGSVHAFAVLSNGKVKAWGTNSYGRLGDGSTTRRTTPVEVDTTERVEIAVACSEHSLFITETGELMTTGRNNRGQLCLGHSNPRTSPVKIVNYGDYKVVQASGKWYYTMFLTKEGDVYSCGDLLGRTTDSTHRNAPGKVQGLGRVSSIGSGRVIAFAVDFDNVLYYWGLYDDQASINAETKDFEVGSIYAGEYHFFIQPPQSAAITDLDNSLLKVNGTVENIAERSFTFEIEILVKSTGSLVAKNGGFVFDKRVVNAGLIKAMNHFELIFESDLNLEGGQISSQLSIENKEGNSITGFGHFKSDLIIHGTIEPSGFIEVTGDLELSDSSTILFTNQNTDNGKLIVDGTCYLDGLLEVDYSFQPVQKDFNLDLITFNSKSNEFNQILINCESFIEVSEDLFQLTAINEIIPDLNHISFISPFGTNEDCCGTASVPCLSLSKIIERMGYYGVVYFEEGEYNEVNFDVGLVGVDFEFRGNEDDISISVSTLLSVAQSNLNISNIEFDLSDFTSFLLIEDSNLTLENVVINSNNQIIDGFNSNVAFNNVEITSNNQIEPFIDLYLCQFTGLNSILLGEGISLYFNLSVIQMTNFLIEGQVYPSDNVLFVENSKMDFTDIRFSIDSIYFGDSNPIIFTTNSSISISNSFLVNSDFILLEAVTSEVVFNTLNVSNCQSSLFINTTLSSVELNNVIVNHSIGQFLLAQDTSEVVFRNVTFEKVACDSPLIEVIDSNFFSVDFDVFNCEVHSLLNSLKSNSELIKTYLTNLTLINGNLLNLDQSYLELTQLEMVGYTFDGIPNVFTCNQQNYLINSINSTFTIIQSNLIGCLVDTILYFDLNFTDSTASFLNFFDHLALTRLSLLNSTIELNTQHSVLVSSIELDEKSTILGKDKYLNLELMVDELSTIDECVGTREWQIEFNFHFAELIEDFVFIHEYNSASKNIFSSVDFLLISFKDNYAANSSLDYFEVHFSSPIIQFFHKKGFQLFSPDLSLPPTPTQGKELLLNGTNLGHDLLLLSSSTINFIPDSPINHEIIAVIVPPGAGCHDVEVRRSLDNIVVFMTFCFEPPSIDFAKQNPYKLEEFVVIYGNNFFDSPDLVEVELQNSTFLYSLTSINHTVIVLKIENICNLSFSNVPIVITIGGQVSNTYQLGMNFPTPIASSHLLNPFDEEISVTLNQDITFNTLSQCNDIEVVGNVPLNWTIAGPTEFELIFDLAGVDSLQLLVQLSKNFMQLIEVPVVDFYVLPTDYICITNQICIIKVCVLFKNVDLHDYFPIGDDNVLITDYEFDKSGCMLINLVVKRESNEASLQLCSESLCNTLQGLPKVVTIDSLSPSLVQWEYKTTDVSITLTGENFDFYNNSLWEHSFLFGGKVIDFSIQGPTSVTFTFEFTSMDNQSLQYIGFGSVVELFTINCDDFLVIVPFYFLQSELIIYSHFSQTYLELSYGNEILQINAGENSLITQNEGNSLFLNSRTVSEMIELGHISRVIKVNVSYNCSITFPHSDTYIEIYSLSKCFVKYSSTDTQIELEVFGSEVGVCVIELVVSYHESKVTKEIVFQIVEPPKLELLGNSYLLKSDNITLTALIKSGFSSFNDFYLAIDNKYLANRLISFVENAEYYVQTIEFILTPSNLNLTKPVSFLNLELESDLFGTMLVAELQIFDVELFSNSTVSFFEHRDVLIEANVELKPPLHCVIQGKSFDVIIDGFNLICKNVIISTYKEIVKVSIYYFDLEIGSLELISEPFFVDRCFVPDHVSHVHYTDLFVNKQPLIHLFDKTRCCLVATGDCYSSFKVGEKFTIQFTETYQITSITLTTNSSCSDSFQNSPIRLGNSTNDLWNCESLLNGFDDALMCSIEVDFSNVTSISFEILEDLLLFEVEIYGYKTNKCLRPIDDFLGITPSGDFVFIDGYYEFAGEMSDSIYKLLDNTILSEVITEPFTVNYSFFSADCYYSTSILSALIEPQKPQSMILVNDTITMISNSFILNFHCRDSNNLMVNCFVFNQTNLVNYSSFSYNHYYVQSFNSIKFDIQGIYPGNHSIHFGIADKSKLNFLLFQQFKNELLVNLLQINQCNRLNLFYSSCVLITLELTLNTQDLLVNYTQSLSLYEVELSHDLMITHYVSSLNELEVTGLPLGETEILFSHQSTLASAMFTLNDCDPTRINLNNECHCKPGTVLGSIGECEPCQLGYYLDNPLLGQCIGCPLNKITKSIGSSNISECVCPNSEFDDGEGCIKCPKFSTCEYGELASVSNGYKFTLETGAISCPYRYSCRNNQCRFNTKGIDCTECIDGTKRYGFVCVGTSAFTFIIGVAFNLILAFLLILSEHYLRFSNNFYDKILNQFTVPSLSASTTRSLVQSKGQIICPLRLLMVLSVVINGNVLLITVPFSLSASIFGNRVGFSLLIFCFIVNHYFCRKVLRHNFPFKDSYYCHFCLFTGFIGIYSKLIELKLDIEMLLLFGVSVYWFNSIYQKQKDNDRFRSLVVAMFLLILLYLPYTMDYPPDAYFSDDFMESNPHFGESPIESPINQVLTTLTSPTLSLTQLPTLSLTQLPESKELLTGLEYRLYKKGKKFKEPAVPQTLYYTTTPTAAEIRELLINNWKDTAVKKTLAVHPTWTPVVLLKRVNAKNWKPLSDTSLNTWLEETDLSSILYLFQLRYDCDAGQYDAWLQQKEHVERVEVDGTSLQASFENSLTADTKYWDIWAAAISKGVADWNEPPATIAKYFSHKRRFELTATDSLYRDLTSFASVRLEQIDQQCSEYRRTLMTRFFAEQEEFLLNNFGTNRDPVVLTPPVKRKLLQTPNALDSFHATI
ncbi:hypothetical protein P9112_013488 [Eukaryota sp. TZLM1-RC]